MLSIPRDTDPVEAQRLIDEECHNYEKRILSLKMQRNTFTSVAKIPDEVLLKIFTTLENTFGEDFRLLVTHVCRHWRCVAIQTPGLWTTLPIHSHNLISLYLERSLSSGLDVIFHFETSQNTAIAVLRNIHRIQALSLIGVNHSFLTRVQEFLLGFDHKPSMLKTLYIDPHMSPQGKFKLLASTFGHPLLLQRLTLRHTDIDWAMLPLPNLTALSLEFMQMTSPLPWETFYGFLAAMPLLKEVCLHFGSLRLRGLPRRTIPVRLPHLVALRIERASGAEILGFLITSTMPSLQQVDIVCNFQDPVDYASTIEAISSMIERGNFGVVDELHLFGEYFSVFSNSSESRKRVTYGHPGTSIADRKIQSLTELLSGIFALTAGGKSTLRRVTLGEFSEAPWTRIVETFAPLPSLESMTIGEGMASQFLNGLNIPMSAATDARFPFPNLKSIAFDVYDNYYLDLAPVLSEELLNMLLDRMVRRCNCHAPIVTLSIPWNLTQEQFQSLKDVVVDVKFNHCAGIQA